MKGSHMLEHDGFSPRIARLFDLPAGPDPVSTGNASLLKRTAAAGGSVLLALACIVGVLPK